MAKQNYDVIYDESGKLLGGVFYEFVVQFDDEVDDPDCDASWIVIPREPPADKIFGPQKIHWMWAEVLPDWENDYRAAHDCSISKKHVTGDRLVAKQVPADLYGGQRLSEFIPSSTCELPVVGDEFARRLKKCGLSGLAFIPIKIKVNQSGGPDPKLFLLNFQGTLRLRPEKVVSLPNECPFCGFKPLVCPECGNIDDCPRCGKVGVVPWNYHEGPKDKRLKSAPIPRKGRIVIGKSWDGKDFCSAYGGAFITKRALDWLLCVHAAPFYVRPARVLLDGMSKTQLAQLKKAQQPLTVN